MEKTAIQIGGLELTEDKAFVEKHLARNVPRHFGLCVEQERVRLIEVGGHSPKRLRFVQMLSHLSEEEIETSELARLDAEVIEIELRFVVLKRTVDRSVPPTPIKKALASVRNRLIAAEGVLRDDERDGVVRAELGLPEGQPLPASREAFDDANTLAERAAIARAMLLSFSEDLDEVTRFFDYKANLSAKGASTQFSIIYAVNALADLFERENTLDRKAAINLGISTDEDEDHYRYTGAFRWFMTEFLKKADDSFMFVEGSNTFADRLRKLTLRRQADPKLFELLHGQVTVEDTLEFMKRAEAIR
jgi:hypothetical protein